MTATKLLQQKSKKKVIKLVIIKFFTTTTYTSTYAYTCSMYWEEKGKADIRSEQA